MTKRLHLLLGLLLLTLSASAQLLHLSGDRVLPALPESQRSALARYEQLPRFGQQPRFAPRRAISVDPDRQTWWGYYPDDLISTIGLGSQGKDTYWAAIGIPASESIAQGKTIRAARFILDGTPGMKNFHFWIADRLPRNISEVALDIPVKTEDLVNKGFTELELPSPYAVPAGKTLYVGYTFEIAELVDGASYPLIIRYNGAKIEESLWLKVPSLGGDEWMDDFISYGPLAVQVLLDGDFPHNAVDVSKTFLDIFALAGGTAEASLTLTSRGLGEIKSIDYVVGDANADGAEQHLDIKPFAGLNAQSQVRIPMTADAAPGRTPRYVTITKVNGVDNVVENATSDGYFVTLSQAVPRRTIVEEFTGTWCGWCPRGIVGMQQVNERFPGKAITIVVHNNDPMTPSNYGVSGDSYPSACVDRGVIADPYYGITERTPAGICDLVAELNAILPEASVELQQPVLSKNGVINFKTDVTFYYDNARAPYAMGYVLLADGLTGTGRDWAQHNSYSRLAEDYADDPLLKPWVERDAYVTGLTFDHVAVAAKGMSGTSSDISAPIKDGVKRTLSSSFTLNGNTIVQNFRNLRVVAVLFNMDSGYIVNADVMPVEVAEDFSQNRMQVKGYEQTSVIKGEEGKVSVPVANYGANGIRSIDYLVREGLTDSDTLHLELPRPITSYGVYENVEFPLPARDMTGLSTVIIVTTKVNGMNNEGTTGKTASGQLLTVAKACKRRSVIEEFTGTWCMWCPRGMAALKRLTAEYSDDVVVMAIHGGRSTEPMQVTAFNNLLNGIEGFPSANINRYLSCDPMYGTGEEEWGIIDDLRRENSQPVEASVELHQPALDKSTGVINFTTDVTFQINRKSAPYLLSYVLVADGLTGTSDDWKQVNAYAAYYAGSYTDDPYMNEICNVWETYADVTFDHVAIAGLGIDNGVTGSLKNVVEEGQTQSHSAKFTIKSNKLAQKATRMRVIALLYDKTRKCFINADEKEVVTSDAVQDTLDPAASAAPAAVYNLAGQRLAAPRPGVNIIGGRKVLVK